MRKFLALLKVSLRSLLTTSTGLGKGKRKAATGLGSIALFAFLGVYISSVYSVMLLDVLAPIGMESLLFIYMGMGVVVGGLLYTVFAVKSVVFEGKDNDLLLSLPVSSTMLMISRVLAIYVENLVFSFFVLVPAGVCCAMKTGAGVGHSVGFWIRTLIAALALPMLDCALSVVIGAVMALFSSKVSKKSWGQHVFMAVLLVLVFWFSFNLNGALANLAVNAQQVQESLGWALPIVWMAEGILGDWVKLLLFVCCCIAVFAVMAVVLGSVYRKAVTSFQAKSARNDYRMSGQRFAGQIKALLKKEAARFFSNAAYFWNGGLGLVFLLVIGVLALVRRQFLLELAAMVPALPVAAAVIGFCLCTCIIAAPSISLEGRYFWLLREAPVSESRLVWVKTGFQIMLAAPCALICAICLSIALTLPLWQAVVLAVFAIVFSVGQACFGMLMGLTFPKLDAVNDTVVIKQSLSSLLSMFIPMAAVAVSGVGYAIGGIWLGLAVVVILCAVVTGILWRRGPAMLQHLS